MNGLTEMPRIAFIGLGLMGMGMARNIGRAGFPLIVFNRTRAKAESLAAEIACTIASSPGEAAAGSDIVITMVSDVPDVDEVYLGSNGILSAARPGLVCVDMSTVGSECVERIGKRLEEKEALFVDAPVSGGSWGAENGALSIMAGGPEEAYTRCLPVFEAMGKTLVHCGPVGAGQAAKLVNQVVGALNLEAVCEGVLLAAQTGARWEDVWKAVSAGASASWAWTNLAPRVHADDFAPGFKIDHMAKDLRLALEAARRANLSLPGVTLVLDHIRMLQDAGRGQEGTQALITALRQIKS